jgi:hypothetical protein
MKFQAKFVFRSNTPEEIRAITATDWPDAYTQAMGIITSEGWTDAVLKTLNRIASDVLTRKQKINKLLLQFTPYVNLSNQDKTDIVNFIDGKLP